MTHPSAFPLAVSALVALLAVSGCTSGGGSATDILASAVDATEQECMARAMYFESNRSSEVGMLGVGTVVMNRVNAPEFPDTVCGVVGQRGQFASGVMTRKMGNGRQLAMNTAQKVLNGARHSKLPEAKFFHTAGYSFGYGNMDYRAIAGGNAFYRKVSPRRNPGYKFASQTDVERDQAANGAGAMVMAGSEPDTALALTGRRSAERAADNPFMQLWGDLTAPRRNATPPVPAARPAEAPAASSN